MNSQSGKTALITGATSGIGRELANLFAKDGYNLVLVARSGDSLNQIAKEYEDQFGIRATPIAKDLSQSNAPDEIYAETQQKGIEVNVLVNDAGMGEYGLFATETNLQKELDIIQINAVSLVHLTKLYVRDMVARNEGKILMLGSEVSVIPNPMMAVYGATKAFIYSFSEALINELKDTEVSLTILMPGATNTDFFNKAGASDVKGADPSKTADPADVAKAGYNALMKNQDKVVAGLANKARVAVSHLLPNQLLASNVRKDMTPKSQTESQDDQLVKAVAGVALAATAVAGVYWLYKQSSVVDKAKYWYEEKVLEHKVGSETDAVADAIDSTYKKAKAVIEHLLA